MAVAVFFGVSILIVYSQWSGSLGAAAGQNNKEAARLVASWVSDIIDREASRLGGAQAEIAVGNVVQDEPSGEWNMPFKITVKNEHQEAATDTKVLVNITEFFKPFENFKIGRTGHAVLVDDKSYLIYYPGTKPFANKFCSYDDLQKMLNSKDGSVLIDNTYLKSGKAFVSYERVNNPLLLNKGINWLVIVSQDSGEVYRPLKELLPRVSITGIIFIIIAVFAGIVLGGLFLRPITKLKDGMRRLGAGELDCSVPASGSDEIGRLAGYFNDMVAYLKNTTVPNAVLSKEVEAGKRIENRLERLASEFIAVISKMKAMMAAVKTGSEIDKLSSEMDNALELVLAESGRLGLKIAASDIKSLLKKTVFLYEPKIREKGLDLKVDIPKGALDLQVDEKRITQVFNALIENAIRRTEKGHIDISIKELQGDAECAITYTGAMISQDELTNTSELAVARGVIETHGGRLWSESESSNISKLKFILPKRKNA